MTGWVSWVHRCRWWLVGAVAIVTTVAAWRTVLTYAALKSDLEELLPPDAPSVAALQALRARLPGVRYLGIVVDTGGPENVPAAHRFVDDLSRRIRDYPPELVASVQVDAKAERRFLETYALQLMDPDDVRSLREAVERRRDWDVSHALGTDLLDENEDPRPTIPLGELTAKYAQRHGGQRALLEDRFVSQDGRDVVFLVRTNSHSTSYDADAALLRRVRADTASLGFPERYAAGLRMGYAGDVATRVEEMDGLITDLSVSGVLVVGLVLLVLRWFFGSWWSVVVLGLPLGCGTLLAFGAVALPPLSIRHLNSNTGILGSVIVGNGINSGIILLARWLEERQAGAGVHSAMSTALSSTWRATLAAALAASAAYGSLVLTDFRGFNQFGWIGGLGLVTCWGYMYLLIPLLVGWVGERWQPPRPVRPVTERNGLLARLDGLGHRILLSAFSRPRGVLLVTALLGLVAISGAYRRGTDWLEHDFSQLRRRDSFVSGERYWGKRMDRTLERYLTPTVILASEPDSAGRVHDRVLEVQRRGGAGGLIQSVRSGRDVLPPTRDQALTEARRIKSVLTPRLLSELEPEDRRLVEGALSERALEPLVASQIPDVLAAGLREHDGRMDRSVLVFPALTSKTWDGSSIRAFAHDLREAASVDPGAKVAGSLPLSSDIAEAMKRNGALATLAGLFAALAICGLALGSLKLAVLATVAVTAGVGVMLGILGWTNVRLNFANFVVLPITFGVSADYAINVLRRYQTESTGNAPEALARTGGAVALCSTTTIIGFGSLLAAQNQALFSFGVFATMGELVPLATTTLALSAWLMLRRSSTRGERGPKPESSESVSSVPGGNLAIPAAAPRSHEGAGTAEHRF